MESNVNMYVIYFFVCVIQVQECISLLSTVFNENCDVRIATCVFSCSLALRIHARTENSPHQVQ